MYAMYIFEGHTLTSMPERRLGNTIFCGLASGTQNKDTLMHANFNSLNIHDWVPNLLLAYG